MNDIVPNYEQDLTYPPRIMGGVQPCHQAHLGHYFGALKTHIDLHHEYPGQSFYMIADYHSLSKGVHSNKEQLRNDTLEMATSYLALGLDPGKAFLYRQSDVPELMELNWIFNCFTPFELLTKTPAFKAAVNGERNSGTITHPVLMIADILSVKSNIVPVGADQVPYVEMARDTARKLNALIGPHTFPIPKPELGSFQVVPGTDGINKMSIRQNNFIPLFARFKKLEEAVNAIVTGNDKDPKDPKRCTIHHLYQMVATREQAEELAEEYLKNRITYNEAKYKLLLALQRYFGRYEDKYYELKQKPNYVMDILRQGFEAVRHESKDTLLSLRQFIGINKK